MTPADELPATAAARLFTRLGQPVDAADAAAASAILLTRVAGHAGEGRRAADVAVTASWPEAARILDAEDRDNVLWDAAEAERERLWDIATERFTETDLLERLASTEAAWKNGVRDAARIAGERKLIADPRFAAEAARAAQTAFHHGELARLAIDDSAHPFRQTLALFLCGRWPLGWSGNRFWLF